MSDDSSQEVVNQIAMGDKINSITIEGELSPNADIDKQIEQWNIALDQILID